MNWFIRFVSPSAISGVVCVVINVNVWWTMGIVLLAQYVAVRTWSDQKKDDGQDLGTVLGLSTLFFLPVGFVCFLIGRSIAT